MVACLLGLINIGSTAAFQAIVSLTINCLYASYLIVCGLLLYRRCTGFVHGRTEATTSALADTVHLVWGPWRVPGLLGIANNALACLYLTILLFFSFWPAATPVSATTMNYSVLVMGVEVIFSIVYYYVWANKTYDGPVVEIHPVV